MSRAMTALGMGSAALMAASLLAGLAGAEPTGSAPKQAAVSAAPAPPSLEYRAHPIPRRGYDRVRRATPPRVEIESRGRRFDSFPYAVYVDPWRRGPSRH